MEIKELRNDVSEEAFIFKVRSLFRTVSFSQSHRKMSRFFMDMDTKMNENALVLCYVLIRSQ